VVSVFAMGPMGSGPAEDGGFLWVIKTRSAHFLGGEVKPSVPCRRFTAISRTLFLTLDSPASPPDGSGC
jgi:hypothetical protein